MAEVEEELRRQAPNGEPITQLGLGIAISRLNSRLRRQGLSAYELWTRRDQYSNTQLPIDDINTIRTQHQQRLKNHPYSERSKCPKETRVHTSIHKIAVGDLVYLRTERDKTKVRNRYLVVSIDRPWCFIKKFTNTQIRAVSYKVRLDECYRVPSEVSQATGNHFAESDSEGFTHLLRPPPKYPHGLSAYESHPTTCSMNINIVNTCVSLYRVTVAEVWDSLTNLEKKQTETAPHMVSLFILVKRVTSARLLPLVFARIILCIVIVQGLQYITLLTVLVFIE